MTRPILAEVSGNSRKGPELTPYERGKVVARWEDGKTVPDIHRKMHIARSTIRNTIEAGSNREQGRSLPRSGRPKALSRSEEQYILYLARRFPKCTYRQLGESILPRVSRKTIYRILKRHHITRWRARKRPFLTKEVAKERYRWAKIHRHWTDSQWEQVEWSDECSVAQGKGKGPVWVFRTPQSKWDNECVDPKPTGKKASVMVWGAFSLRLGRSDLVIMERDANARKHGYTAASYIRALEQEIPRTYESGMLFMQDNAPIHTARIVKEWLRDNSIRVLKWPPYSPDLNPIEHLWALLKRALYQQFPGIEQLHGPQDFVERELGRALQLAWESIQDDVLQRLGRSMRRRVQAVYKAKGWHTKY
jgi:transposase